MKSPHLLSPLFIILISLLTTIPAMGQEKLNIAVGLGEPELLNLGIRYQMGQSQVGLSAGFWPARYEDIFSAGADYYYHFGNLSSLSARRPWYGRIGLNYRTHKDEYENKKYLLLVPRLGKDFNISPKLGMAADGGFFLVLSRDEEGVYDGYGVRNDIGLSLGVSIFYRL